MKQRDLLKGRVKRLLKEQKDMGQVGESAVLCCASAVQLFVRDLAKKMQKQSTEGHGLTPIELKKSVLASEELHFLHEKVTAIDESAAKYHKPSRGGKKRTRATAAKKSSTDKTRAIRTAKKAKLTTETTAAKPAISIAKKLVGPWTQSNGVSTAKGSIDPVPSITKTPPLVVEEDEDYDESDSDA